MISVIWLTALVGCATNDAASTQNSQSQAVIEESRSAVVDLEVDGVPEGPATTPTVAPPASTTASTVQQSTTTEPSRALDVSDPEVVVNAVAQIEESWAECLRTLPSCDVGPLLQVRTGEQAVDVAQQVEQWNAASFSSRDVESRAHEVLDVRIDVATAEVDVCQVDGSVLLIEADVVPGQPETIVDSDWLSTTQTWNLQLVEDRWLAESITARQVLIGEENNQCSIGSKL